MKEISNPKDILLKTLGVYGWRKAVEEAVSTLFVEILTV